MKTSERTQIILLKSISTVVKLGKWHSVIRLFAACMIVFSTSSLHSNSLKLRSNLLSHIWIMEGNQIGQQCKLKIESKILNVICKTLRLFQPSKKVNSSNFSSRSIKNAQKSVRILDLHSSLKILKIIWVDHQYSRITQVEWISHQCLVKRDILQEKPYPEIKTSKLLGNCSVKVQARNNNSKLKDIISPTKAVVLWVKIKILNIWSHTIVQIKTCL